MTNSTLQSDSTQTLIGVTRSPRELTARVLTSAFFDAEADKLHEAMALLDFFSLCRLETYRLDGCPVPLNEGQRRLGRAWQALRAIENADADALFHVLIVLLETTVEAEQMPALPPLTWGTQEAIPLRKPTAAHPRAFQGTKYQPPKIKTPASAELRPYLCDAKSIALILTRLRPFWPDVMTRLEQAGYDARLLREWEPENHGLYDLSTIYEVYTIVHHGQDAGAEAARLPLPFRSVLLPLLRGLQWNEVKRFVALFWRLQLDADAPLRSIFARLLACQNDAWTLKWGELLVRQPATWRTAFCCLLIQTGAYRTDPAILDADAMQWLEELDGQPFAAYRLYCLLRALVVGVNTSYLLTGFQLADAYETTNAPFHTVVHSGVCPLEMIERIAARIGTLSRWQHYRLLRVWEACGELTGFARAMEAITWEAYTPEVANSYAGIFTSLLWQDWTDAQKAGCWRFVRQNIPIMEALLHEATPAYQAKCVALLAECVWGWGEQDAANAFFARSCPLIRRLCAPPFRKHLPDARFVAQFAEYLDAEPYQTLLSAPDSSFLRLEEACARQNNAALVQAGLWSLLRFLPHWVAASFTCYPAKLCKVARLLGCFSDGLRDQVTRGFRASFADGADRDNAHLRLLSLAEARDCIDAACAKDCTDPVPRPIRDHLADRKALDAPRLAHYQAEMEKGLYLAQLEMLGKAALDVLCRGYETDPDGHSFDASSLHALEMRCHITDNRRAFGKFLRAYFGGSTDHIRAHPRSQAWLGRHSYLSPKIWLQGLEVEPVILEDVGSVQLAVEQDPLEALKMGTSVGSCLGLGGSFAHSAIANVLDINKQIIYARSASGTLLARQLVAISEERQLVCFEIYPLQAGAAMQRLFRQYDTLWAEALGLTLYRNEPDTDYTIVNVLSARWWDDNPWDFTTDEDDTR